MSRGQTIGLVGWKYFEPAEWDDRSPGQFVPHYLVAMLGRIAGSSEALREATPVLHASDDWAAFDDRRRSGRHARMEGRRARLRHRLADR